MANNSTQCKAWCIALVSAVLVVVADNEKPDFAFIAVFPAILFFALDTYYLSLENGFKQAYKEFVAKVHNSSLSASDLFTVEPMGNPCAHRRRALGSFSVWGFYLGLLFLILVTRHTVLG